MQHVLQIGTYGVNVADTINKFLHDNPKMRLDGIENINVSRAGGTDVHVLAIFEERGAVQQLLLDMQRGGGITEPAGGGRVDIRPEEL